MTKPVFDQKGKTMSAEKEKNKPSIPDLVYAFYRDIGTLFDEGVDRRILVFWRGNYYLWNSGVYHRLDKTELKTLIVGFLQARSLCPTPSTVDTFILNLHKEIMLSTRREPNTWLSDKNGDARPENVVVADNGIILISEDGKITLREHTSNFFSLSKVPFSYDPKAKCPRWERFIQEITLGDAGLQRLLQQWAGYTFLPNQKYQSFIVLAGEGATGKGTYARTLKNLHGTENCSELAVRRFVDKFALYSTYGKKINIVGDADSELRPKTEEVIKNWTGGDALEYEQKYGSSFFAQATAKLMILVNEFPSFTDKSTGLWRRLLVVPTDRSNKEFQDPNLDDKLKLELPGIFNWALEGLIDLESSGGFIRPEPSKEAESEYRREASPASLFLQENYLYDSDIPGGVGTSQLYQEYRSWCKSKGYLPLADHRFGREVRRIFPLTKKSRVSHNDIRIHVYKGVHPDPEAAS